jgi:phenylpropionate dioxygenase-like ring-hydroxylating dioxygenase large terminal subunit
MTNMKTVPTQHYTRKEHLDIEKQEIFSTSWLFASLSGRLPKPNMQVALEVYGHSVLLVRDEEGVLHAFQNSCLHRGTELRCSQEKRGQWSGKVDEEISCPYHGWKYDLSGTLRHIPKKERLLTQAGGKLKEFQSTERFGLIWICFGIPKKTPDQFFSKLDGRLEKYQLEEMRPVEARDFEFPVNWKISLENTMDFYHVSTVHSKTVGAHIENLPSFEDLDWHNLQTLFIAPYSWRELLDKHCARGDVDAYSPQELSSLHKYFVFPNLVINVLPYHLTIMQLWPIDQKTCLMRYRFCMREKPGVVERMRTVASWVASRVILYEDVRLYPKLQRGVEEEAIENQTFHEEEIGGLHFHQALDRWRSED